MSKSKRRMERLVMWSNIGALGARLSDLEDRVERAQTGGAIALRRIDALEEAVGGLLAQQDTGGSDSPAPQEQGGCGCGPVLAGDHCCLAAEVDRLTAKIEQVKQAAAEVLADRDQRIEAALALLHHPTEVNGCMCLAHQIAATLRGECDE